MLVYAIFVVVNNFVVAFAVGIVVVVLVYTCSTDDIYNQPKFMALFPHPVSVRRMFYAPYPAQRYESS